MERKVTKETETIFFDRDVHASELNLLFQDFYGDVIITKKLIIDQDLDVKCNLYVMSSIAPKNRIHEHSINVDGDLYCYSTISINDINVTGCFYGQGIIYATGIKVGENMWTHDEIHTYEHEITVKGNLECKGIVAGKVRVFGTACIECFVSVKGSMKIVY